MNIDNISNKQVIEYLNEAGTPEHDHPENGGRVSWRMVNKYGNWLYRNDPIAFECAKQDILQNTRP